MIRTMIKLLNRNVFCQTGPVSPAVVFALASRWRVDGDKSRFEPLGAMPFGHREHWVSRRSTGRLGMGCGH
jgi:hypothetical protein